MDTQELDQEELFHDLPNQTWFMGAANGVESYVHFEDGKVITEKRVDLEPIADYCHALRIAQEGTRWGEHKHVGVIPSWQIARMAREGTLHDTKEVIKFFRANPHLAAFDKVLK